MCIGVGEINADAIGQDEIRCSLVVGGRVGREVRDHRDIGCCAAGVDFEDVAAAEVGDGVGSTVDLENITPSAAGEDIVADSAVENIAACATDEGVVALTPAQVICKTRTNDARSGGGGVGGPDVIADGAGGSTEIGVDACTQGEIDLALVGGL